MKTLIISLMFLSSVSAFASSKISCQIEKAFDDYTVEVNGNKAALFDNDNWNEASYEMTLESIPSIDVFESNDSSDPFKIYIKEFPLPSKRIDGTLFIQVRKAGKDIDLELALKCKKVSKLIYLE